MSEKDNRIMIFKAEEGCLLFRIPSQKVTGNPAVKKRFTEAQILSYTLVKHIRDRICKQFYYTDPALSGTVSE